MIRNPYQAYADNDVVGSDPLKLVLAMYETAIEFTQEARNCLESGDIWGRTRAISKASRILTELIVSLNPNVGTEIGQNLDRLYHYMQGRLQEAHVKKAAEPLLEVETLLKNLLDGWYKVAETTRHEITQANEVPVPVERCSENVVSEYGNYLCDTEEDFKNAAVLI